MFEARGPQHYRATLAQVPSGELQMFMLAGDEWQLDARVLKWKGWANLLGLDAQYRLERVSGRYRDIEQERKDERTVYGLSENPGLDLWTMSIDHKRWLPFVDAVYGSAVYLPMADGARYEVAITQSGLLARPVNDVAKAAAGKLEVAQPTHTRALRQIRIHGLSSPHSSGCQEFCAVRNTRSGCGISNVTRPSGVVMPVSPRGEPFGFAG